MVNNKSMNDAMHQLSRSLEALSQTLNPRSIDEKDKRRNLTPFFCFYMDTEDQLDMSLKDRLKTLTHRWTTMSAEERKSYHDIMVEHRKQYTERMHHHYLYAKNPHGLEQKLDNAVVHKEKHIDHHDPNTDDVSSGEEEAGINSDYHKDSEDTNSDSTTSDVQDEESEEENMDSIKDHQGNEGSSSSNEDTSSEDDEEEEDGTQNKVHDHKTNEDSSSGNSSSSEVTSSEDEDDEKDGEKQMVHHHQINEDSSSSSEDTSSEDEDEEINVTQHMVADHSIKEHATSSANVSSSEEEELHDTRANGFEKEDSDSDSSSVPEDSDDDDDDDDDDDNVHHQGATTTRFPHILDVEESSDDSSDATSEEELNGDETAQEHDTPDESNYPSMNGELGSQSEDDDENESLIDDSPYTTQSDDDAIHDIQGMNGNIQEPPNDHSPNPPSSDDIHNEPPNGNTFLLPSTRRTNYDSDSDIGSDSDTSIISLTTPITKRPMVDDGPAQFHPKKRRYSKYEVDEVKQEAEFERMERLLLNTF
ncbi:hypothetical protein K501DRAFT_52201 [Backusella circina FSU 941]|nr:hypothetical protein K501DRAFT_52201 [Backusella circina FSU 941]